MKKPFDGNFKLTQNWNDPCCRGSYLQFGLMGHNGWDIGCPTGTAVLAPHEGIVMEVVDEGTKGYGKYIKVENNKEGSILAHLKEFKVSVNQEVKEGDIIAYSDNTGNSTGPHLHWGYYRIPRNKNNGFNGYIDQSDWLNSEIIAQPIAKEITDNTKIPGLENKEVQQVRSELLAKDSRIKNLEEELKNCQILMAETPIDPPKTPQSPLGRLLYQLAQTFG